MDTATEIQETGFLLDDIATEIWEAGFPLADIATDIQGATIFLDDTATEIRERGILLDDGPSYYDPATFVERLPKEFMASGYSVPRSPGDRPQMIPVELLQAKHVRRDSAICGAEAGSGFVNVKVLHRSQVAPVE